MPENTQDTFQQFRRKLDELFQMDRAELDFGIYRIMNIKRREISRYLEEDLYPQVEEILANAASEDAKAIQDDLDKKIVQARELGVDPEALDAVKELRAQLDATTSPEELRQRTFSHLLTFFSRYYDKGDFISKRRYKDGTYMIPYNGEEVKLVWANMDQYYVKTSEYLRDYRFFLNAEKTLRMSFKLVEGDTERDNIKGKNRIFQLRDQEPVTITDDGLVAYFEYLLSDGKQKDANTEAQTTILERSDRFRVYLEQTDDKSDKMLLEKHLAGYTARNSEDYFIHKDLKGFLERELDFFLKNEVLRIDDIIGNDGEGMLAELHLTRAIKDAGGKIIAMLAQIEEFQKKLWLKRKMVTSTNYLVTLDKIIAKAPDLLHHIVANDAQREEWVRLFAIDEITGDLESLPGMGDIAYSEPLTEEFLRANDKLVLDTRFFDREFVATLLPGFDDIDAETDGLLVHSENFQALNLLKERYREKVKCIYIDPPYNTGGDGFAYKDQYKHSSWLSALQDRIRISGLFLSASAGGAIHLNDIEDWRMRGILESNLGEDAYIATVITKSSTTSSFRTVNLGPVDITDRVLFFAKDRSQYRYQPVFVPKNVDLQHFSRFVVNKHEAPERWRFRSIRLEVLHSLGYDCDTVAEGMKQVKENLGRAASAIVDSAAMDFALENADRVFETKTLQKPSQWLKPIIEKSKKQKEKIFVAERDGGEPIILRGGRQFYFLGRGTKEVEGSLAVTEPASTLWMDIDTNNLKKEGGVEFAAGKKPIKLVNRVVKSIDDADGDNVLDFFAGSGTTGHAVINLNREDDGSRKYILVEMGEYFDTVLKPRIAKVVYSVDWKDGKPQSRDTGVSQLVKYIRLESYEDTLNNLTVDERGEYSSLLEQGVDREFREGYLLGYMLDWEAGAARITAERFAHPFHSILNVAGDTVGERRPVTVDLAETFNYLIGLTVKSRYEVEGCRIVEGYDPFGDHVLAVWRDLDATDNEALNELFLKQRINIRDREFDLIYVSGDNNLENIRRDDESWKVRLIEHEFTARMFAGSEV
jgi:adenine-specific DNA-methyltransferase